MTQNSVPAPPHRRITTPLLFILGMAAAFFAGQQVRHFVPAPGDEPPATSPAEMGGSAGDVVRLDDAAQRRLGLRFATAELRTLQQTIQATGNIGPDETRVAHIRALARGRIATVYVKVGDHVREGQPLLTYDNADLGEAVGQYLSAVAALDKSNREAEVARRAVDRATSLVSLGAIAKAEYDRRDAEHRNALASVESRRAEAAKEEEKLHRFGMTDEEIADLGPRAGSEYHRQSSNSTIRAPFAGTITKVDAVSGEPIGPDDVLVTVSDLSTVWVQADVYEKDIAAVRRNADVTVSVDAYPGRAFAGKVTYVSDFLDPNTRTAKVRCEVSNSAGLLKPDMFAAVRMPAPATRRAVVVPAQAIQRMDDQSIVFIRTGTAGFRRQVLKLGEKVDGCVEALEGVRDGEEVVTEGSFLLKSELKKAELGHHGE